VLYVFPDSTKITYQGHGVTLWFGKQKRVSRFAVFAAFGPPLSLDVKKLAEGADEILVTEGLGFGEVTVGATPKQIERALGAPEEQREKDGKPWLVYRGKAGLDVVCQGGAATDICFYRGSPFRLKGGPGFGTPLDMVLDTYGKPLRLARSARNEGLTESRVLYRIPGAWQITYAEQGILFWFNDQRDVQQFVIFEPRRAQDKEGGPEEADEAGVPEKLKRAVALKPPYPQAQDGYPKDRISVQRAVSVLCAQAGLGYDWQGSYAATQGACARWIEPNVAERPFAQAINDVLLPLGLTFKVEGDNIVLLLALEPAGKEAGDK